ncbi:MAG: TonB-dependent receptor, partial [Candidatus Eremiobacteraeota bacterium]|nr:TonB-dependent receptor [Candidatus Eremiobacteraeota bacterium]
MLFLRLRHVLTSILILFAMVCQTTGTQAGTTGALTGVVTEAGSTTPVANATVTANSPSQQAVAETDQTGHFAFVSLSPDTYDISVVKGGFEKLSQPGVTVFADQTQTLSLGVQKTSLREIGNVTSRAAGDLIKSGTTADVYSVNAAQSQRVAALGGGGGLNNAYSAIASVPGAYVPLNQNGYYQTVHIRGGDYDQVGYELDGVPVNRSFDNYPAGTASSLGQQELQVYTGASPANSEGQGLAGYINQVIRTGTHPGFASVDLAVGAPTFYHKAAVEVGGATPNRNFSYYIGIGGYNQDAFRYVDNNQGDAFRANYGTVLGCVGGCNSAYTASNQYVVSSLNAFAQSGLADRDLVGNFHIAIPHRNGVGKDDVQILFDSQFLKTAFYDSTNDQGANLFGPALLGGAPFYIDSSIYTGPTGAPLPGNYAGLVAPYYFPDSPRNRCINAGGFANSCAPGSPALIPASARDAIYNNQEIVKVQYQKNFSSNAFARVYGYTYYSDWLQNGPQTGFANYFGPSGPDYELNTHTRGFSAQFTDQINDKHLINLQGSYSSASTLRNNNTTMYHGPQATLVDSNNPNAGYCYDATGTVQSCLNGGVLQGLSHDPTAPVPAIAPGTVCGTGPCQYYVVENGLAGKYNTVVPKFSSYSITDQFKPNDRLLINLGLRNDIFTFNGSSTTGGARDFWFNSFNNNYCIDPATNVPIEKSTIIGAPTPTTPCSTIASPSGASYTKPALQNASAQSFTYTVFQPRIALTYTQSADTVYRASYGKYVGPPTTAYEQYNVQNQNLADFLGNTFYPFGFTTPGHAVRPSISYNFDFSYERHIKGTDMSLKLTPFLRKTQDQVENFFLDQKTGFVSGLNVGSLTARGFEFQFNKGDFNRNGLSGQLAFTYTNAYVNYGTFPNTNGLSIVTQVNQNILKYNSYTKFCATNAGDARCKGGAPLTGVAAPCYVAGAPDPT